MDGDVESGRERKLREMGRCMDGERWEEMRRWREGWVDGERYEIDSLNIHPSQFLLQTKGFFFLFS